MHAVVIQSIGLFALLTNLLIFQTNTRKYMLQLGLAACLLWAIHFYFLGAVTGVAMNLVAAARFYVYRRAGLSRQKLRILWLFVALTILATVLTWDGPASLLPFVGTISLVIAFWQENPKYIRRLAIASSPPWIIYGYMVGSYPVIATETLLLLSNLIGQYRFDFGGILDKRLLRIIK